ncbi:MAG: hypothetical protein J0H79_11270 [Alphaproteobacteria bacterium]|jgi:hypothetical protein|nr:hypothetical protein [Alphaproteobacteria bacterium]MBN9568172.1 hypothetical protein [Alphaproteobacteria bacterium]MBN9579345.1 hypothetical protein [Alphaproteobacteria bacterium]
MKLRLLVIALVALGIAGCGVKSDLVTPSGKQTQKDQHDPSRPPQPLGQ